MDELLDSRFAKLSKTATGTAGVEPIAEVQTAWDSFVVDLRAVNEKQKEMNWAVRETIINKLSVFHEASGPKQDLVIQHGQSWTTLHVCCRALALLRQATGCHGLFALSTQHAPAAAHAAVRFAATLAAIAAVACSCCRPETAQRPEAVVHGAGSQAG